MIDFAALRHEMVEKQIAARGVRSKLVLDAMRAVPREAFLPERLREFAYEDSPLPIDADQTISQPYIVAFMTEALDLQGGEKVLEIGAGSGYAAAVLSRIAGEVYTVERIGQLAEKAASALSDLAYSNVHVLHGDGTLGWPEHAPFDAIIVAAGGPSVPQSLKEQLKVGGRLVIPVGTDKRAQELVRVTRVSDAEYRTDDIADVRFVPLVGEEGWSPEAELPLALKRGGTRRLLEQTLADIVASEAQPFPSIDAADLRPILDRIGDARVVLLGEATHGTSEFYRMRNRITRTLILEKGFNVIGIEGDWPDAARIDHYVRHLDIPRQSGPHSPASRPGCGETTKCAHSLIGLERTTDPYGRQHASPSTVWIFTACTTRSALCFAISTMSIRNPQRSHARDTAASRPGRLIPRRMVMRR